MHNGGLRTRVICNGGLSTRMICNGGLRTCNGGLSTRIICNGEIKIRVIRKWWIKDSYALLWWVKHFVSNPPILKLNRHIL